MDPAALAREYYRAIDEDAYEMLEDILAEGFVHVRPDRTIEGRKQFVTFMRDERPVTDTEHHTEAVYVSEDGDVAAEGRLLRSDGSVWFRYVDAFDVENGRVTAIRTYTGDHPL